MPSDSPFALIVAGPTCSGKSALALALAERLGGGVINADSMQVYRELRILTARPTPQEEARAPHRLYGIRPAAEPGNAAWWRAAALAAMSSLAGQGRLPILCGGTGLYLDALVHGIADIPAPTAAAREEARRLLASLGAVELHARLRRVDPATAATLSPQDGQRIARAWEVWRSFGQGLASFQRQTRTPAEWRFAAIRLDPPRALLREALAARFAAMLAAGALEEVRQLDALGLDPALPAMRAHGVPELRSHLRGEIPLAEAQRRAALAIGRYTKRQGTWLRHHALAPAELMRVVPARIGAEPPLSLVEELAAFVAITRQHADSGVKAPLAPEQMKSIQSEAVVRHEATGQG